MVLLPSWLPLLEVLLGVAYGCAVEYRDYHLWELRGTELLHGNWGHGKPWLYTDILGDRQEHRRLGPRKTNREPRATNETERQYGKWAASSKSGNASVYDARDCDKILEAVAIDN